MHISSSYESFLFPAFPNEIGEKIIRNLTDQSLYKLSVSCKKINKFIVTNKQILFSPNALKNQMTYNNILKIFGSMKEYEKLPVFDYFHPSHSFVIDYSNMYSRNQTTDELYFVYAHHKSSESTDNLFWVPLSGAHAVEACKKLKSNYLIKLFNFYVS